MNKVQVRWKRGQVTTVNCTAEELPSYLANLPMEDVVHVEFGEYITGPGFATEVKRSDVDISFSVDTFYLDMHKPDGKRITTAKYSPVQFQKLALDMLQQTYYRFEDATKTLEDLQFRMDGLDK